MPSDAPFTTVIAGSGPAAERLAEVVKNRDFQRPPR